MYVVTTTKCMVLLAHFVLTHSCSQCAATTRYLVGGVGGGYIYQKAYVEAFVSPDNLSTIIEEVSGR